MKSFYAALAAALIVTGAGCSAIQSRGADATTRVNQPVATPGAVALAGHTAPGQAIPCSFCGDGACTGCGDACAEGCYGEGCYDDGSCGGARCGRCGGGPCGACRGLGCRICGGSGICGCLCKGDNVYDFQPGPPVGQVAYPYYTVRGPRDFLNPCPTPIGPR